MEPMPPLTRLQILAILTVVVSIILSLLGFSGAFWAVVTASILICIVGACILRKMNKSR